MHSTYRSRTGFYGLTDMPAAFQKLMEFSLAGIENTRCFLDDIIIVSRVSQEDHLNLIFQ